MCGNVMCQKFSPTSYATHVEQANIFGGCTCARDTQMQQYFGGKHSAWVSFWLSNGKLKDYNLWGLFGEHYLMEIWTRLISCMRINMTDSLDCGLTVIDYLDALQILYQVIFV